MDKLQKDTSSSLKDYKQGVNKKPIDIFKPGQIYSTEKLEALFVNARDNAIGKFRDVLKELPNVDPQLEEKIIYDGSNAFGIELKKSVDVIDLSYDNFPSTYNRTLSLKSSGSQYEGANNFIISTWTPSTPEIRINQNHSRYPSGIVTESGILNHRMRAHVTFTYGGCTIDVNPGFETTGRQSNSLSVIVQ
jgi:hypothetical protein